ncbi:hypothetical protein F8M41_010263 [Gigaspora margarita]|uniref:Uncharacterized protein n=1 Tax=Gigaspora margarita TaxID=4874 RepID=A0A8H3X2H1_GIGMA|nr:hypothetical protein F8M41_010263 [Gigaspora margarita]
MLFFLPTDFAVGALFTRVIRAAIFRCNFTSISESIRATIFGCNFVVGAIITGVIGYFFSFRYDFTVGAVVRIRDLGSGTEAIGFFSSLDMISPLEPSLGFGLGLGFTVVRIQDLGSGTEAIGFFSSLDMISPLEPSLGFGLGLGFTVVRIQVRVRVCHH